MYKLIVSDIDATLIDSDFRITPYNREMIQRALKAGVDFMLCTGRIYGAARPYAKGLGLNTPVIASNGAVTIEWQTGNVLFGTPMTAEQCSEIFEALDEIGVYYHFYTRNTFYTRKFLNDGKYVKLMNKDLPEDEKFPTLEIDDPAAVAAEDPVYKIGVKLNSRELFEKFTEKLGHRKDISITSSYKDSFEISAAGVNKGAAVRQYAELRGIKPEEIISFGDNFNDIEMIKYAGAGVAVGNAVDRLKEAADFIADTNENSGVGKMIAKLVFGEE